MKDLMLYAHLYAHKHNNGDSYKERLSKGLKTGWDLIKRGVTVGAINGFFIHNGFVYRDQIPSEIAQAEYCEKNHIPNFALDGRCICGNNIYNYYTIEYAESHHITACPYCHRSLTK